MTFVKRSLSVKLQLDGDTFDGANDSVLLDGLRVRATIMSTQGGSTPYSSSCQLRVEGMRGDDMAKLSTLGLAAGTYNKNSVEVFASDQQGAETKVFSGEIFAAYVDYNAQPDVGIEIVASSTARSQVAPIAASSYPSSMSVATMLQGLASSAGLAFRNNGVTSKLMNHAENGSAAAQIAGICQASLTSYEIADGTLTIWPQGATRDDTIVQLSAETGLIGYPSYSAQGIDIRAQFLPDALIGRQATVRSSIPAPNLVAGINAGLGTSAIIGASGTFYIYEVVHDLSAELPGGPWFSNLKLGQINNQVRAS